MARGALDLEKGAVVKNAHDGSAIAADGYTSVAGVDMLDGDGSTNLLLFVRAYAGGGNVKFTPHESDTPAGVYAATPDGKSVTVTGTGGPTVLRFLRTKRYVKIHVDLTTATSITPDVTLLAASKNAPPGATDAGYDNWPAVA